MLQAAPSLAGLRARSDRRAAVLRPPGFPPPHDLARQGTSARTRAQLPLEAAREAWFLVRRTPSPRNAGRSESQTVPQHSRLGRSRSQTECFSMRSWFLLALLSWATSLTLTNTAGRT